jgi:predicted MPP superfamily phosphohydrolase
MIHNPRAAGRHGVREIGLSALVVAAALTTFCLADWALLRALPLLRLSFAPSIGLALSASILVRLLLLGSLAAMLLVARWQGHRRAAPALTRPALLLFLALNLGFSLVQVDAYAVEPLLVETTELSLAFDDLDGSAPPVRIVQISDTHIERSSFREATVIREVKTLQPDLVLLSGDYLNLSYLSDPTAAADFQRFITQIEAPYGIYAVRGTVESAASMARLLEGTDVVWLEQEAVTLDVRGQSLTLVGVGNDYTDLDAERLAETLAGLSRERFTLLLYHTPDLIHEAAELGVDLYLGGHTHGGQIRLPFYGAIVTFSRYGRQYASGLFQEGGTTMYISRGLGFEGGDLPRVRFLCRPEIVAIELAGKR